MALFLDFIIQNDFVISDSLNDVLADIIHEHSSRRKSEAPSPFLSLFFWLPFVVALIAFVLNKRRIKKIDEQWKKGVFNNYQYFERDYLLEAYLRMSALLIIHDRNEIREKQKFILKHAYKYFPDSEIDLGEIFSKALRNPVKPETVSFWIKKHLRNKNSRLQFLYFLVGVATKDGNLNYREEQIISEFGLEINLNPKEIKRIISMHSFHYERTYQSKIKRTSLREKAYKILGVSTSANQDEIKKAYRSLAKKHHPDRMIGQSKGQIKIARERFIEIQKAYELLSKN